MSFADKTIVLTGASAVIGRSLSISLAQQGANLVLAARNQETFAACTQQGGKAIAVPTDVTKPEACRHLNGYLGFISRVSVTLAL